MEEEEGAKMLDKVVALYLQNPVLRTFVRVFPYGGLMDVAVAAFNEAYKHRMDVFYEELILLNINPATERLKEREFVDAFIATSRRVVETTQDDKIRRFAAMFTSYCNGGCFESVDHFEEYLSILDELSNREFQVLLILNKYEEKYPIKSGDSPLQRATGIWGAFADEVEKQVGIGLAELTPILTRSQRTGLYEHFTGAYMDYSGGKGCLSPLFHRFLAALRYK